MDRRRLRRALGLAAMLHLAVAAPESPAAPIALAPLLPGAYAAGDGVDARFLKVADGWHGSSVRWDPAVGQYGTGQPIGSFGWGSGLWGLADWRTAQDGPAAGMIEAAWSGRVAAIAFADQDYNDRYAATWGAVGLVPLFADGAVASQDNWTARFAGYLRIAEAGAYNFSVLHDDGFFFAIEGAAGQALTLVRDHLNPRDRLGFETDLLLDAGLYRFELGAFDRLETGVVQLDWSRDGAPWSPVPTEALVASAPGKAAPERAVPEPASLALAAAGLLALAGLAPRAASAARGRRQAR
jgi:hypothetical protein